VGSEKSRLRRRGARGGDFKSQSAAFGAKASAATKTYRQADLSRVNTPMLILLLVILVIYVTMVYAPIGALPGRDVPGAHPLHLDVAAVPHRQRLVRRLPADHSPSPS